MPFTEPQTIVITLNPDGNVSVSGPLHDRIFCYGLLEVARTIIQDNFRAPADNEPARLVTPSSFVPTEAKLVGYPPDISITPAKE